MPIWSHLEASSKRQFVGKWHLSGSKTRWGLEWIFLFIKLTFEASSCGPVVEECVWYEHMSYLISNIYKRNNITNKKWHGQLKLHFYFTLVIIRPFCAPVSWHQPLLGRIRLLWVTSVSCMFSLAWVPNLLTIFPPPPHCLKAVFLWAGGCEWVSESAWAMFQP